MAHSRRINPAHFSDHQLQKLRRTHLRLRRLNRAALMHMARIGRHSCDKQRELGKLLGMDASQINSLLTLCQQTIESDESIPRVLTINFVCPKCAEKEPLEDQSESTSFPRSLDVDPAWMAEIDRSLELVRRTEERTLLKCLSHGTVADRLFSSLNRLREALVRQKSHLIAIGPEQTTQLMELKEVHTCTCDDESTDPN